MRKLYSEDLSFEDKSITDSTLTAPVGLSNNPTEWNELLDESLTGKTDFLESVSTSATYSGNGSINFEYSSLPIGTYVVDTVDRLNSKGATWVYTVYHGNNSNTYFMQVVSDGTTTVISSYGTTNGTISGISIDAVGNGDKLELIVDVSEAGCGLEFFRNDFINDSPNGRLNKVISNAEIVIDGTNGDDIIGQGTVSDPFKTFSKAFEQFEFADFDPGVEITFLLKKGTYVHTSEFSYNSRHGKHFTLKGETVSTSISALSVSGTAGNRTMTLTVSDSSDISVGDIVLVSNSSTLSNGGYKVSAIADSTHVTVTYNSWGTVVPSTSTGTLTVLQTKLTFSSGINGFATGSGLSLGFLDSLAIESLGGTATGIYLKDKGQLEVSSKVCLYGWTTGVNLPFSSTVNLRDAHISHCGEGALIEGSSFIDLDSDCTVICSSVANGIHIDKSSRCKSSSVVFGSKFAGFVTNRGSSLEHDGTSSSNSTYGYYCENSAKVDLSNSTGQNNTTYDYYIKERGIMRTTNSTGSTYSPAVDTVGNNYAYHVS